VDVAIHLHVRARNREGLLLFVPPKAAHVRQPTEPVTLRADGQCAGAETGNDVELLIWYRLPDAMRKRKFGLALLGGQYVDLPLRRHDQEARRLPGHELDELAHQLPDHAARYSHHSGHHDHTCWISNR